MKGIILAGGTGTRMKPLTNILNKHLLPVGHFPMIYWPIISLREAGIREIMIITNQNHMASFIELLGDGEELDVELHYRIQPNKGGGIADALLCAEGFIKQEKFVVLLGDNIFEDSLKNYVASFLKQEEGARILLKEVKDPTRYGVPQLDQDNNKIMAIFEKPSHPPSSFCVTGIYMYDQNVFNYINEILPSSRNELEITDVNNLYIKNNQLQYDILQGWWIDAGTHESLYKAFQYVNQNNSKEDLK